MVDRGPAGGVPAGHSGIVIIVSDADEGPTTDPADSMIGGTGERNDRPGWRNGAGMGMTTSADYVCERDVVA